MLCICICSHTEARGEQIVILYRYCAYNVCLTRKKQFIVFKTIGREAFCTRKTDQLINLSLPFYPLSFFYVRHLIME